MKPNWSAAEAFVRALVVLALATFFGALVLPLMSDGSLPSTWAAWKPVLATAFGATVAQELIYIRTHLSQAAQALGLPLPSASTVAAAATKAATMLVLMVGLGSVVSCKSVVAAAPGTVAAVACVVNDAGKGDSVSQIVLDCGGDVAQVIAILADPTNYATVKGSPAYAEAGRAKLALAGMQ